MPYVCELNAYDDMGHLLFHTNWKTKPSNSKIYEKVFFNIFYNNCATYLKTINLNKNPEKYGCIYAPGYVTKIKNKSKNIARFIVNNSTFLRINYNTPHG